VCRRCEVSRKKTVEGAFRRKISNSESRKRIEYKYKVRLIGRRGSSHGEAAEV
jgi:hypothetical protein